MGSQTIRSSLRGLGAGLEVAAALLALNRNHDDTSQVFRIVEGLRFDSAERAAARFAKTPLGARVLAERRDLIPVLADREALAGLPGPSLGRAYLAFAVDRGITAEGLASASHGHWNAGGPPEVVTFQKWIRDTHDLWHVVTGYGSDPLGELALLAFTFAQYETPGTAVIAALGALRYTIHCRDARIAAAVWDGYRSGRRADWLPAHDWAELLGVDLQELRWRLGIPRPTAYERARALMPGHERRGEPLPTAA